MVKRRLKRVGQDYSYQQGKDYTYEEVAYILLEYGTVKNSDAYYKGFCKRFGDHRTKAALLQKSRKLTGSLHCSNYYTVTEIAKTIGVSRKAVLWQAKKLKIPITIIRRTKCVKSDCIDELFSNLKNIVYNYRGYMHIVDASNILGVHRVDLHYARRVGYIEMVKMPDAKTFRGGMANYIRVETVDYIVSKMRETGETQVKWKKWFKKNPKK